MAEPRYVLLKAATAEKLAHLVSEHMERGWQPAGGAQWYERELTWVQTVHRGPGPDLRSHDDVRLREPAGLKT